MSFRRSRSASDGVAEELAASVERTPLSAAVDLDLDFARATTSNDDNAVEERRFSAV